MSDIASKLREAARNMTSEDFADWCVDNYSPDEFNALADLVEAAKAVSVYLPFGASDDRCFICGRWANHVGEDVHEDECPWPKMELALAKLGQGG